MRWTLALIPMLWSCADSIKSNEDPPPVTTEDGRITTTEEDGTFTTLVDSTDVERWVYFSFTTKAEVLDPSTKDWDLSILRFKIQVNGGVSGTKGVEIVPISSGSWDNITRAPEDGWIADEPDSERDENSDPDYAFSRGHASAPNGWFKYNLMFHTLKPADVIYVVHVGAVYYKLQFLAYYDEAGTAGWIKFRWRPVDPPVASEHFDVTVPTSEPAYVSLFTKSVLAVASPKTSLSWDLGLEGGKISTNSGESGPGVGGVIAVPKTFEEVTSGPSMGYDVDTTEGESALLNGWSTAQSPTTYLVRGGTGRVAKVAVESFSAGQARFRVAEVDVAPEAATLTVRSSTASWTFVSLRTGADLGVRTTTIADDWDLGFSGDRVRTNGGTSGPGLGGAIDTGETDLAQVMSAPSTGYVLDEVQSADPPYSASPVLAQWIQGGVSTGRVFVVMLADGGFAKLKLEGQGEQISIRWVYAGPGRQAF